MSGAPRRRISDRALDLIERIGNALPDPVTLFIIGALTVMALSQIGAWRGWKVEQPITVTETQTAPDGTTVEVHRVGSKTIEAVGLLDREGLAWAFENMVTIFTGFHPLGVVLVAMLGIGVAEKTGLIGALLRMLMLITPQKLLTPTVVFVGIMSSMAADAGYVVLPPVAAALYKAVGRSPLVGLAAVFAGVSAGYSANLLITSLDPLLAGLSTEAAQILDENYEVAATSNWFFMIASTILLTAVGWAVTAWFVEPRYRTKSVEDGGPSPVSKADLEAAGLTTMERKGLRAALVWFLAACLGVSLLIAIPGAALHGVNAAGRTLWVQAIVPIIFLVFLAPAIGYGVATGTIRDATPSRKMDKGVAKMMGQTMADMGPYIVLAFFAAQFVEYFRHSNLGVMLAILGGEALSAADMPAWALMTAFTIVVMIGNLFIGSASAKWAFFAPVFVPMFMQVGLSPELTQAAYRVGDSCTNIVSPLNPYVIIILVFMQKYVPKAGIGTLVSLMLPYAMVFWMVWIIMLIVWMTVGAPLGPGAPLEYVGAVGAG